MQLSDFARGVPDEAWAGFEPVLPQVAWQGNGRKPYGNRQVLHALLYVLVSGIARDMLPLCFPSAKTVKRRLKAWLELDVFRDVWGGWPSVTRACTGSTGTRCSSTAP